MGNKDFSIEDNIPEHYRGISDWDVEAFGGDRGHLEQTLTNMLIQDLSASGIHGAHAWNYVKGYQGHLRAIADKDSGWIRATITEVEEFDNYKGSKIPGKKARIHFTNLDGNDEYLETSWIERDYDSPWLAWEMSLSRTLAEVAEKHVGKDVLLQKQMIEIDGGLKKKREALNLIPIRGAASDDEPSGGGSRSRSSGKSSKRKKGDSFRDRVETQADKLDKEGMLNEDDLEDIIEVLESTNNVDELLDWVADFADVDDPEDNYEDENDIVKWLILVLMDNL